MSKLVPDGGIKATTTTSPVVSSKDSGYNEDPLISVDFSKDTGTNESQDLSFTSSDRRMSREWDAAKVPPSQFQRPKGSIYSTPGTRDGHVRDKDQKYWDKLKEKGWDTGSK